MKLGMTSHGRYKQKDEVSYVYTKFYPNSHKYGRVLSGNVMNFNLNSNALCYSSKFSFNRLVPLDFVWFHS